VQAHVQAAAGEEEEGEEGDELRGEAGEDEGFAEAEG
jgi:hypothetical protein